MTFYITAEVLSLVFLLLSFYPIMRYGTLAGVLVPQHFTDGRVDIWTTRTWFIYASLIFIALFLLLTVCQLHPTFINVPISSDKLSAKNRTLLASSFAQFLKVWCMAMCAYLSISNYRIALGKAQTLNSTVRGLLFICGIIHLSLIILQRRD